MNAVMAYPRPALLAYNVSEEAYLHALRLWIMGGEDATVAGLLGMRAEALPTVIQDPQWIAAARQLHQSFEAFMEIEYSRVIGRGLREIEDRLINGEVHVDQKGHEHKIPPRMRDVASTVKVLFDGRKEFQRMASGQADPSQTHADALMRIARVLSKNSAFEKASETVIDVTPEDVSKAIGVPADPFEQALSDLGKR